MFALECLKEIGEIDGEIIFDIYGPVYDKPYWEECKKIIVELPENIKVTYKGVLAGNEVFNTLSKYHFMFMPTRGENFGYSILESFMAGRPVLISDRTPWRDLEAKRCGYDLSLERGYGMFVNALLECLKLDQEGFEEYSLAARKIAVEYVEDERLKEENIIIFEG
jgi:glycosyltransferase involved in cell wall biosynthesis